MVVAGGIEADARVRKSAQTVQRLGYDVTLLYGLRKITKPKRGRLGDVSTIGLPLPYDVARLKLKLEKEAKLKDEAKRKEARLKREKRSFRMPFLDFESQAAYEWARHQNTLAGLKASAYPKAVRALLRLPRAVFRVRERYYLRHEARFARKRSTQDRRKVNWETEVPLVSDLSLTFTKEIWRHQPDIIHAHDAHVLKAAVHAKHHMWARGRRPSLIYDAHEFVAGSVRPTERLTRAWAKMESHYIRDVDAVITVSESIADALQRNYRLKDRPTVVLNAPVVGASSKAPSDIRSDCGLDDQTQLVAYTGSTMSRRGVATAIEALTLLPELHLAIVCVPNVAHRYSQELAGHAQRMGVADRVHLLEPVKPEEVLDYLRTADVGVHPMIGDIPNHEMALPNKLFDYIFAGLPVVVSDLREMGTFVRRTGVGEAFAFGDASDCARAFKEVFGSLEQYQDRIRRGQLERSYSWESQEEQLRSVYGALQLRGHPEAK